MGNNASRAVDRHLRTWIVNHSYSCALNLLTKWLSNVISTSRPVAKNWDELKCTCEMMLLPKQWRTSGHSVQVKTDLDTKVANSIVLSKISCVKVVTSPVGMVQEESPSMEKSLLMKISPRSTLAQESCPWPTLEKIRMDLNFSCVLSKHNGWMASMWYLEM